MIEGKGAIIVTGVVCFILGFYSGYYTYLQTAHQKLVSLLEKALDNSRAKRK